MNISNINPKEVYSSKETAIALGLNNDTVNRWCREGRLKAVKLRGWKILGQKILDCLGV